VISNSHRGAQPLRKRSRILSFARGVGRKPVLPVAVVFVILAAVSGVGETGGVPGGGPSSPVRDKNTIVVPLNKSRILDLRSPVARVSVANPAIADILVVNPRQIYLVGKQLGTTNMVLWDDGDRVKEMMGLEVTHDLETLKEKLYHFMPNETIRVESAQGAIVLSGEVSSVEKLDAALRLAQSYAGSSAAAGASGAEQPNVLNLLQVGGSQQVLLEVKVAEISRSLSKRMNIDFTGVYNGGSVKMGLIKGGANFPDAVFQGDTGFGGRGSVFPIRPDIDGLVGPVIREFVPGQGSIEDTGAFLNTLSGNFYFNVILDMAKTQGLAKVLAEPNLTTLTGQEAKFLAGGEFPVPVPQSLGNVTIEFKEYGVSLAFVPIVLDSGLISLKVNVSVSELAFDNAVALSPEQSSAVNVIPSLRKRGANSTVEVPSGQTIALAGLINEDLRQASNKFPGLGEIPVLGALFRSVEYQKGQTELMIFVTPRLARPIRTELVELPTDDFVEPSDVDFYLMGRLEGRRPRSGGGSRGAGNVGPDKSGSEGPFGHDL